MPDENHPRTNKILNQLHDEVERLNNCALGDAPTIDYKAAYEALREKHDTLVKRLGVRVDGAEIGIKILDALEDFCTGTSHMPALFLRAALRETLKQMSINAPLRVSTDRE